MVISSRKQANVDNAVAALQKEGLHVTGIVCHVRLHADFVLQLTMMTARTRWVTSTSCAPSCSMLLTPMVASTWWLATPP